MYSHLNSDADTDDIILLFNHYLQVNHKLYIVYIDAGSYFTSQKLCIYFQNKDLAVVFALLISHKLVGLTEKSNNILQQVFKKMREFGKE